MIPERFRLIATSAALVRAAGPAGAIWVGNAIAAQEWSEKEHKDEWWHATKAEIEERTGLSAEMQETARRRLRDLGVLDEKRGLLKRGASLATIWYRLDFAKLSAIICRETRQTNADDLGKRTPTDPANDHASGITSGITSEKPPIPPEGGEGVRANGSRRKFDETEHDDKIPLDFHTPEFIEQWHAWLLDLKDRGKRPTARAADGHIRHLVESAKNPAVAIEWLKNAITKGWQFPYEPRGLLRPRGDSAGPAFRSHADTALTAQLAERGSNASSGTAPADPNW